MTQLYYYLWSAAKGKCYADKAETIDTLEENIREAFGKIQLDTIDNVLKIWTVLVRILRNTALADLYPPKKQILVLLSTFQYEFPLL